MWWVLTVGWPVLRVRGTGRRTSYDVAGGELRWHRGPTTRAVACSQIEWLGFQAAASVTRTAWSMWPAMAPQLVWVAGPGGSERMLFPRNALWRRARVRQVERELRVACGLVVEDGTS